MSFSAKLIVSAVALAIVLPMAVVVPRRMLRGEPFERTGTGTIMPPSGPPLDGGGV